MNKIFLALGFALVGFIGIESQSAGPAPADQIIGLTLSYMAADLSHEDVFMSRIKDEMLKNNGFIENITQKNISEVRKKIESMGPNLTAAIAKIKDENEKTRKIKKLDDTVSGVLETLYDGNSSTAIQVGVISGCVLGVVTTKIALQPNSTGTVMLLGSLYTIPLSAAAGFAIGYGYDLVMKDVFRVEDRKAIGAAVEKLLE